MSSAGQVLLETVPASAVLSVLQSWSGGAVGVVGAERGLFIDLMDFHAFSWISEHGCLHRVRHDLLPL